MHLDEMCDDDKLSSGSKKKVFWRPWDIRSEREFVKDEQIDFQSKIFQPKVLLQKLSIPSVFISEIKVESNKNEKCKDEAEDEQIDFQSKRFQPKVQLQKLSGSEIKVESNMNEKCKEIFEAEEFKLVTDMLNATKGEQIDFESVVRAMAMFEAEDFKRPW